MHTYIAFGLGLHSDFSLPELTASDIDCDISIYLSSVADITQSRSENNNCFVGEVSGVGTFLVRDGRQIKVAPEPRVDPALLRTILLGPVFCVLLRQRGLLVLHASCISVQGHAVAFLAASGWGKSTLAEVFHKKGYGVLTDDVMAIQLGGETPLILPSLPQIKLWPESAIFNGYKVEDLPTLYQNTEKRSHRLKHGFLQHSLPLKRIYIIADGPHHKITKPPLQEIFIELLRHSRAVTLLNDFRSQEAHFKNCTELIQRVSIRRLQRLRSLDTLPELIKLIELDITDLEQTNTKHNLQVYTAPASS